MACESTDNIGEQTFGHTLCPPVVDVVYTWVNGSDPEWIAQLLQYKRAAGLWQPTPPSPAHISSTHAAHLLQTWNVQQLMSCWCANPCALNEVDSAELTALLRASPTHPVDVTCPRAHTTHNRGDAHSESANSGNDSASGSYNASSLREGVHNAPHPLDLCPQLPVVTPSADTPSTDTPSAGAQAPNVATGGGAPPMRGAVTPLAAPLHVASVSAAKPPSPCVTRLREAAHAAQEWSALVTSAIQNVTDLAASDANGANRYRDSDELRFSVRSVFRHAPWVRRLHLVTNGQVPAWLDISHPRVRVVTHAEIFRNVSQLPVFSSPAIEVNLHRIPDLAPYFIYFNDDVLLGDDVWPDDFATHAKGVKVYLSWDVPKCAPGCIEQWIGDGYCDSTCNTDRCMWDGGDCVNNTRTRGRSRANRAGTGAASFQAHQAAVRESGAWPSGTCALGCPDTWLADGMCDTSCRTQACAWDAGDCGTALLTDVTNFGIATREQMRAAVCVGEAHALLDRTATLALRSAISSAAQVGALSACAVAAEEPRGSAAYNSCDAHAMVHAPRSLDIALRAPVAHVWLPSEAWLQAVSTAIMSGLPALNKTSTPNATAASLLPSPHDSAHAWRSWAAHVGEPAWAAPVMAPVRLAAMSIPALALPILRAPPADPTARACTASDSASEEGALSEAAPESAVGPSLWRWDWMSLARLAVNTSNSDEVVSSTSPNCTAEEEAQHASQQQQQLSDGVLSADALPEFLPWEFARWDATGWMETLTLTADMASALQQAAAQTGMEYVIRLVAASHVQSQHASHSCGAAPLNASRLEADMVAALSAAFQRTFTNLQTSRAQFYTSNGSTDASLPDVMWELVTAVYDDLTWMPTDDAVRQVAFLAYANMLSTLLRPEHIPAACDKYWQEAREVETATFSAATLAPPTVRFIVTHLQPSGRATAVEQVRLARLMNEDNQSNASAVHEGVEAQQLAARRIDGVMACARDALHGGGDDTAVTARMSTCIPLADRVSQEGSSLVLDTLLVRLRLRVHVSLPRDWVVTWAPSLFNLSRCDATDALAHAHAANQLPHNYTTTLEREVQLPVHLLMPLPLVSGRGDAQAPTAGSAGNVSALPASARRLYTHGAHSHAQRQLQPPQQVGARKQSVVTIVRAAAAQAHGDSTPPEPERRPVASQHPTLHTEHPARRVEQVTRGAVRLQRLQTVTEAAREDAKDFLREWWACPPPLPSHAAPPHCALPLHSHAQQHADAVHASARLLAHAGWSHVRATTHQRDAAIRQPQAAPTAPTANNSSTSLAATRTPVQLAQPVAGVMGGRRLEDTYADSLIYTNRLITRTFGRRMRRAPAHMPHMIDVHVMQAVESTFASEFESTSGHRFRNGTDVQYAFAYFHFIMEGGAKAGAQLDVLWREQLDTDADGVLNTNEMLTLAAIVFAHTPTRDELANLTTCLVEAGAQLSPHVADMNVSDIVAGGALLQLTPALTLASVASCSVSLTGLQQDVARRAVTHEEAPQAAVAFEMIVDDEARTMDMLTSIRARRPKFICVNDDMSAQPPPRTLKLLSDFFMALFPAASPLELPLDQLNPILTIQPLRELRARQLLERRVCICVTCLLTALLVYLMCSRVRNMLTTRERQSQQRKAQ